ncbi:MAG: Bug family tripartite tricarboxylate transporter substrate binding protein, partial [Candidatus Binatia bacterium]
MTRDFVDSFKRSKVLALLIFSVVELLNPLNLEPLFAQANFYQGKTITMVVASTASGGYDLWARLTARYLAKYIPGNPTIVVQNMPGAGNIIGANYVYSVAKPDGLT